MGLMGVRRLIFIAGFLLSGNLSEEQNDSNIAFMDFATPMKAVPVFNPSNPTATTTPTYNPIPTLNPNTPTPIVTPGNPNTTPGMGSLPSAGQSWCIASQTASQTALQVALDYACGYGGADCSEIQPGSSCFNPDSIRDHASYAFNSYYQKNPIPTSCDFGGTAVITTTDPSTSTCQFPSASTSPGSGSGSSSGSDSGSPVPYTTPTGSTIYGSVPPDSTSRALRLTPEFLLPILARFLTSMFH